MRLGLCAPANQSPASLVKVGSRSSREACEGNWLAGRQTEEQDGEVLPGEREIHCRCLELLFKPGPSSFRRKPVVSSVPQGETGPMMDGFVDLAESERS